MRTTRRALGVALASIATAAAAPAPAANLLVNPHFDSDSTGWEFDDGGTPGWTNGDDEGGCAGSGAAQVASSPGQGAERAAIVQCVSAGGGLDYFARARHKGSGEFTIRFRLFHTTGCGGIPDDTSETSPVAQSPTEWGTFETSVFANMDTSSVEMILLADHDTPHDLFVDAVELSLEPSIFADDFERNEDGESQPCRWAAP